MFILSGGYLLGGLMVEQPDWVQFRCQFLNVHLLLFGGATAFNSWWDKDAGPIGGLRHPPAMEQWMRDLSLYMQLAGLIWAYLADPVFGLIYLVSIVLFWLYSTPWARWKGRPVLSVLAIGISTGTNSLFLGVLAAGGGWSWQIILAGTGTALIIVSLYPVSQVFQQEADRRRSDLTFARHFGMKGVRRFFLSTFLTGVILISLALQPEDLLISRLFAAAGVIIWMSLAVWIYGLKGVEGEYGKVMRIKFMASFSFVTFITVSLIIKHLIFGSG